MSLFVLIVIMIFKPEIWAAKAFWLCNFSQFLCKNKLCTGAWSSCGCRQRQFPTSQFQCLTLIFTWFGGFSPSAGGPRADPWVFLALIVRRTQNPVKFPDRFRPPLEKSARERHRSCQRGLLCTAFHGLL